MELFEEHPILTAFVAFLLMYGLWYWSGGVERALERRAAYNSASIFDRVDVDLDPDVDRIDVNQQ